MTIFRFSGLAAEDRVQHFVSTRHHGASAGPFASLNLSFRVGDQPARVLGNRQAVMDAMGIKLDAVTAAQQVHGTHVRVVTRAERGRGARDFDSALPDTDALITDEPGICLLIMAADCVPVLLFDPRRSAIGVAHAGWRGTVAAVVPHAVRAMRDAFGSQPGDLRAAIGPSIGPDDYEVGDEVVAAVRTTFPASWQQQIRWVPGGHAHFDLWAANRLQLVEAGVPPDRIEVAAISTYATADHFFSERRAGRPCGRFAAGLMLR